MLDDVAVTAEMDRPPIPEPLLSETVTDLDSTDAGEYELEANAAVLRARRGGAFAFDTSVELEWLITRRLGVRIEPTLSHDAGAGVASTAAGVSGGASWKLFHDFARDLHIDAELLGRVPTGDATIVEPGDSAQPVTFDVRAAARVAWLTLRASAGAGAFGDVAHSPVRGSAALLAPFEASGRFGFWGLELDGDGARQSPFVIAANIVPNLLPAGIPIRVGLALPWVVGERDDRPSLGIFLRVFYESGREIEFATRSPSVTGR